MVKHSSITHTDADFAQIEGDNDLVQAQFGEGKHHYSIQSAAPTYDSSIDYLKITPEQTKHIFDDGYKPQNGSRTVFKIDVRQYITERAETDKIDLKAPVSTVCGK